MPQDSSKKPTPNDQRSNVKNPNNPQKQAADDNRSRQLNPESPAHPSQQPPLEAPSHK